MALVAGYARRISGEADQRQILALDRLGRLADANALLFSAPPGHPDPARLARPRRGARHDHRPPPGPVRLRRRRPPRARRHRPALAGRSAARARGPPSVHHHRRAARRPLRRAMRAAQPGQRAEPAGRRRARARRRARPRASTPCSRPAGRSSACSSIEHGDAHHFTARDVELLNGLRRAGRPRHRQRPLVRPPPHRRRRRGAHPHRPRPARPHRPVARLPRLRARPHREERRQRRATSPRSLEQLRDDVRGVIREVRDTLYDLRTDVSEAQSMLDHPRGLPRPGDASAAASSVAAAAPRRRAACRSCRSASCGASPRRPSPTSSATPAPRQVTISWRCDGDRGPPRGRRRRHRLPGRPGRPPRLLRHARACASGPPASAPPSTSTPSLVVARGYAAPSMPD